MFLKMYYFISWTSWTLGLLGLFVSDANVSPDTNIVVEHNP